MTHFTFYQFLHNLPRTTAEVINIVTNSSIKLDERKENVDMCQAIEDIKAEVATKVKAETFNEALKKLIESGMPENEAKKILGLTE